MRFCVYPLHGISYFLRPTDPEKLSHPEKLEKLAVIQKTSVDPLDPIFAGITAEFFQLFRVEPNCLERPQQLFIC